MNTINRDELKALIETKGDYILIDVRETHEMQYGAIPTAHNLPMSDFIEAFSSSATEFKEHYSFDKPAKNAHIILYCRSGNRSAQATLYLSSVGYTNVKNYNGSILDWAKIDKNVQVY